MHSSSLLLVGCIGLVACAGRSPKAKTAADEVSDDSVGRDDSGRKKKKKKGQSYGQAWRLICNAETLSGIAPGVSRAERGQRVASWIAERVTNRKARYWWIAYGSVKRQNRERIFRRDAAAAGFTDCPLARLLFTPAPASGKGAAASSRPTSAPPDRESKGTPPQPPGR